MRSGAGPVVQKRAGRDAKRPPVLFRTQGCMGKARIFSEKALLELGAAHGAFGLVDWGYLAAKTKRYRTSTARTLGLAGGGSSGSCEETRAMKTAAIGGPAVNKGKQLWEV